MKKLILPTFFMALAGCQPADNSAELRQEIEKLKSNQQQIAVRIGMAELVKPDTLVVAEDAKWIGNKDANIVVMEYTDLHCPFCKKYQQNVWPEFKEKFVDSGKVAYVAREFPLAQIHPNAPFAAVALKCADKQGQYEEVKNYLFELGNDLSNDTTAEMAEKFGLDKEKLDACVVDKEVHAAIDTSLQEAALLGLKSTPTFVIGKQVDGKIEDYRIVVGAGEITKLSSVIDTLSSAKLD
ncbi:MULTISPECIES: thioredoxin domain-containing protein [unclassified Pseudoalteromonas]|uniref:thioredoxin domain-containing protein n=1 Tax=unclassified Pseudoalteromonas TaxID=194690 RepID=UPI001F2CCA62|nr:MULTISPECIES: thioredoxin domain-containing protein [unclassified Pseudoalteromonas]MCF2825846.1 thioredoxin domain-containing protein [Pseudoalteromonas sp. OF5H-5]MCF2832637.1 thioredoxin domain-containing protein [Pseudoalteromonas sp. DL2-H6]MCF2927284.1 thioredoxin domain-containing protein [Pseudoalteromonas sp. DL2-H1]